MTAAIAPGVLVHDVWGVDSAHRSDYPAGRARPGRTRDRVEIKPVLREHDVRRRAVPARVLRNRLKPGERQLDDPLPSDRQPAVDTGGRGLRARRSPIDEGVAPLGDHGCHVCAAQPLTEPCDSHRLGCTAQRGQQTVPTQISQHTALDAEIARLRARSFDPRGGRLHHGRYRTSAER